MSNESEQQDLSHAHIGIVCALPLELSPFLDRCDRVRKYVGGRFTFRGGRYDQIRVVVAESGVGFERARRATQALIEAHTPDWILSCGFSGALRDGIRVGDIVMATTLCDTHGNELKVDLQVPQQPRLHSGRLLTADELVRTVDEKRRLAEQFQAIAVDMESLAVAQVCKELQRKFLAIRTISDDLSEDLPPEILTVLGSTGTQRLGAAVGALWKRPGSYKDLWKLREAARKAAERLADFVGGSIRQLVESPKDQAAPDGPAATPGDSPA